MSTSTVANWANVVPQAIHVYVHVHTCKEPDGRVREHAVFGMQACTFAVCDWINKEVGGTRGNYDRLVPRRVKG